MKPKTNFLDNLLFDTIKYGAKGKGKCFTSYEICSHLCNLGFTHLNSQHIGIFLSKNGYFSPPTSKHDTKTYFIEFKKITPIRLNYLINKYNPILKKLDDLAQKDLEKFLKKYSR